MHPSYSGNLRKLEGEENRPVSYHLPLGENLISFNPLIGKKLSLHFNQKINCLHTGEEIKKSFFNGYSYKAFMSLPECDQCMVRPELCHIAKGTCRNSQWGEANCKIPHVIYLAWSSDLKIGITRERNLPHRWIDQGASRALGILRVKDRLTAGLIEVEIAKVMKDKTDWRKMLSSPPCHIDLLATKEDLFFQFGDLFDDLDAEEIVMPVKEFIYPMEGIIPDKIKAFDFDQMEHYEGKLIGMRGSYLIFEDVVINSRKYQGYHFTLNILD